MERISRGPFSRPSRTVDAARGSNPDDESWVGAFLRSAVRVEVGYAILLVGAFVLPEWTNAARVPSVVLAIALACGHGILTGRRPALPIAMLVYLGVYLLAAAHSDRETFSITQTGQLLAAPVFALAVAWAAQEPAVRRALVHLSIGALALQVPIVLFQTADLLMETDRSVVMLGADSITGLLGEGQASTLGQAGLVGGMVLLAAGSVGAIDRRWAIAGTAALVLLSVPTSTRVAYLLAPVGLGAIAASVWMARRQQSAPAPSMSPATIAALAAICAPVLFFSTEAVYPGANDALRSFAGLSATLQKGDRQLDETVAAGEKLDDPRLSGAGLTRLPGRKEQLTTAVELSVADGPARVVLGSGIGATEIGSADPITRPEQNTSGVWLARTIVETGYLGVVAFMLLVGYLLVLWWRNRDLHSARSWDGAVTYALPGIASVTLLSALYNPILVVRPYVIFWALLGVAIAVDADRRRNSGGAPG